MHYTAQHFSNQTVTLDGNQFDDCRFTNVVFDYAGGPVHLCGCRFEGFRWQFSGDLARGLAVIGRLYGDNQAAALTQLAQAVFPKPSAPRPAGPSPVHPSLAAILDSADEDDAEQAAIEELPIAYSRLRGAIKRGGFVRAA